MAGMPTDDKSMTQMQEHMKKMQDHMTRMQKATGQLGQTHVLKEQRREIARIKTILAEKAKAGN